MKYIFLVPDGMADYPLKELGGRTPIMVSQIPFMDKVACEGMLGRAKTIPEGLSPGSDVANLSLLGYDPAKFYPGRAPLEAANIGVKIGPDEVAFRCNLIRQKDGLIEDYSAGHISSAEAREIIEYLNKTVAGDKIKFYAGVSYRNLLVIKTKDREKFLKLRCFPPHDITGKSIKGHLPEGEGSELVSELILKSGELLSGKKFKANMIWPWGQGINKNMPSFFDTYKIRGSVVSAVDLVKGIGRILSMEVVDVPGATGYLDTNYSGKAEYSLKALERCDFVFVHVEAPDEASHDGRVRDKIDSLERIDSCMLRVFWDALQKRRIDRILIAADHYTPISVLTHTSDPVPFAIAGKGIKKGDNKSFSEQEASKSSILLEQGYKLMGHFLSEKFPKSF